MDQGVNASPAILCLVLGLLSCVPADREAEDSGPPADGAIPYETLVGAPRWSIEAPVIPGGTPIALHSFERISTVRLLSDTSIVIADGGAQEVLRALPNGVIRWKAGGQGGGPGEFRRLVDLATGPGDTIALVDIESSRITTIGPNGEIQTARGVFASDGYSIHRVAWWGGGFLISSNSAARVSATGPDGVQESQVLHDFWDPNGSGVSEVARSPGLDYISGGWFQIDGREILAYQPQIFGRYPVFAASLSALYVPGREGFLIREVHVDGSEKVFVHVPDFPLEVTDGDYEEVAHARLVEMDLPVPRSPTWSSSRTTRPAFSNFFVSRAGELWVSDYVQSWGTASQWWIFSASGALLGQLSTPDSIRIFDATQDIVATRIRSPLTGVDRPQLFRLVRLAEDPVG